MATISECENAFEELATRLAKVDSETRKRKVLERSISCTLSDLSVIFIGQLREGGLQDIKQVDRPDAQLRLSLNSDDLVSLTDGSLQFAKAWAAGRLRIEANVFDLLKLRTLL